MKYLLTIICLIHCLLLEAQVIDFDDANFKSALVNDLVVDFNGDGITDSNADLNDDGEIQISEALAIQWLYVDDKGIDSISEIEYFVNLLGFSCNFNSISQIDLSSNNNLEWFWCIGNNLTNLDFSQNPNLDRLGCNLNQLTNLNVTQNPYLYILSCSYNNLTSLDLSQNPELLDVSVGRNNLEYLNFQNGNNHLIFSFSSIDNPNLLCIQVDDPNYSANTPCNGHLISWCEDSWTEYSEECLLDGNQFIIADLKLSPNPTEGIIVLSYPKHIEILSLRILNMAGMNIKTIENDFNIVDISNLNTGNYFMEFQTAQGISYKKIIKN